MTTEIKNAVETILSREQVTFSVSLVGPQVRDKWECDAWRFTLASKAHTYAGDYYTGTGKRELSKIGKVRNASAGRAVVPPAPVPPVAADVLYSLLLNADAADMSFNAWCSDLGYDNDSIKALSTYQACCKEGEELRKVFKREVLDELREALQDY